MMDETDRMILDCLQRDARMAWKDIGEQVHMTGQAVATRIRKMEESGIIQGYTVTVNQQKIEPHLSAMVTMFMQSTDHAAFQTFLTKRSEVVEAHRISGEGCYHLKVLVPSQTELNEFLNQVLKYGNYRVNLSILQLK